MSVEQFNAAAEDVKNLIATPSNEDLLEVYALFKQASVGENNTERPGLLDMKGKAKWDAWKAKGNLSQDEARAKYVAKVAELVAKHGKK